MPDRILDAVVSVHEKVLANRVDHHVVHRNVHGLRVEQDVADFFLRNLALLVGHRHRTAVVETANVAAAHAGINIVNLNARAFFRVRHGRVDTLHRRLDIDDLAFAHTLGVGLADSDDHDVAVIEYFADHGAYLGGAHLQPHDDFFFR